MTVYPGPAMEHGVDIIGAALKSRRRQTAVLEGLQQGTDYGRLAAAAARSCQEQPRKRRR